MPRTIPAAAAPAAPLLRLAALCALRLGLRAGAYPLRMRQCDASDAMQRWEVKWDAARALATLRVHGSDNKPRCLEINACAMGDHGVVDTDWGCKEPPGPGDRVKEGCDFNMAWSLNSNGTITSVMSGLCLTNNVAPGHYLDGKVDQQTCTGAPEQVWDVADVPPSSTYAGGQLIGPRHQPCGCIGTDGPAAESDTAHRSIAADSAGPSAAAAAAAAAAGCPTPRGPPRPEPGPRAGGAGKGADGGGRMCDTACISLIGLLCGGVVYFAAGFAYNSSARHLRGTEAIPHVAFWRDVPYLVKDGVVFTFSRRGAQRRRGYETVQGASRMVV